MEGGSKSASSSSSSSLPGKWFKTGLLCVGKSLYVTGSEKTDHSADFTVRANKITK